MGNTSVAILLSVHAEHIHKEDLNNLLNYVGFTDNQPSDHYDKPADKTTFASIADSNKFICIYF